MPAFVESLSSGILSCEQENSTLNKRYGHKTWETERFRLMPFIYVIVNCGQNHLHINFFLSLLFSVEALQKLISELPFASVSRRVFVRKHWYVCILSTVLIHANQTYFHTKGFSRGLVLKPRHKVTRKLSITQRTFSWYGQRGQYWKSQGRRMYLYCVLFCILEENYRILSSTYLFVF